jgi:AraC-like DNA-binding protein
VRSWLIPGDLEELAHETEYNATRLASRCSICLRQLERFFKDRTGASLHSWLLDLRMRRARVLLARGRNVNETAEHLGYKYSPNFCRAFKRFFGFSPNRAQRRGLT